MTLQSTGAISIANINTELGVASNTTRSLNDTTSRTLAGVASGTISMSNFYGKTYSSVTFTPSGGTSAGAPVALSASSDVGAASVTITCSATATWNWTRTILTGVAAGTASVVNGGTGTSITFSIGLGTGDRSVYYTVSGTSGGVTRYWTVTVSTTGTGAVMTL